VVLVLKESDLSEELGVDGNIILKLILNAQDWRAYTGLISFRTEKNGGLF
jgi:hypothetical protein